MSNLQENLQHFIKNAQNEFEEQMMKHLRNLEGMEKFNQKSVSNLCKAAKYSSAASLQAALKLYIESHEEDQNSVKKNDLNFTFHSRVKRRFFTEVGPVEISRKVYYSSNNKTIAKPQRYCHLDRAWGMEGRFCTPGAEKYILLGSANLDPKQIQDIYSKLSGFEWSQSTIEKVRRETGCVFFDWCQTQQGIDFRSSLIQVDKQTTLFCIGMDGANVLMRERGAKRGRPIQKPSLKPEKIESSCSYRNAMVGCFSLYGKVTQDSRGRIERSRINSFYSAKMPQPGFEDFQSEFGSLVMSCHAKLPEQTIKILLMDGGKPLWGYTDKNPDIFEDYLVLLDYYHSTEHLSNLSVALFGKSSPRAQQWFTKWKNKWLTETDAIHKMLRSVCHYLKKVKAKSRVETAQKELNFFKRNKGKMNYREFIEKGYPIGSGPVEAACKTIVKQRMCRSGMRWNRATGDSVLNLRALDQSDHLEAMLDKYLDQAA